jgi:hypothetical protein
MTSKFIKSFGPKETGDPSSMANPPPWIQTMIGHDPEQQ